MKTFYYALILSLLACNAGRNETDIQLNDGEKWEVNAEMRPHIERASVLLENYISAGDGDYHRLADDLKSQNSSLIQSCTMQGESHDQLHKWLHPHMKLVKALEHADNGKEAKKIIEELVVSFESYEAYFE